MAEERCTQSAMEASARREFEHRRLGHDINQMMEVSFVECSALERSLTLCHTMTAWEVNPQGTMHGGLITYLLDAAMAIANRSYTGDATSPTMDIHVNFIRPVLQGSRVFVRATLLQVGRSCVTARAELWTGERERLCAAASALYRRTGPGTERI